MNLENRLSERIHMQDIQEILLFVEGDNDRKQTLYELIFHTDEMIGYQTLWVCCHFNSSENRWLYEKQNELIDEVLQCTHPGKRRLLLNLLYRQPLIQPPRTDFLDFCLERMISKEELSGVQSLCIKLAYELCRPIPELLQEFRSILDIMEPNLLPPSLRAVHRNVLKAMKKGRSLQRY
ncbi:hypothetical protein [Parabacteroides sp. PF5-9]|uniref:hypothetical protein n=1 Tax=Parabacteroides sp. PF5-9 TaxID=1742404 RepID=UPI0024749DE5|nr:hypothetical protein [Parabacteroides sp. PF5-9]